MHNKPNKGMPVETHNMHEQHTIEDVPIVGDSRNSEWETGDYTLHQGDHNQAPTTEVNTIKKKIYK